ncbi:MAG: YbhN family protein, partial [Paracoccaceae bacterium]
MVFLFLLLRDRLVPVDWGETFALIGDISPLQWAAGLMATGLSFWALGQYDAVVHRLLRSGVGRAEAWRSGMAAIAISQAVGFGLITGSLVRWRLLPALNLAATTKITLTVTLSFLLALTAVTSATILAFGPIGGPLAPLLWFAALAGAVLTAGFALLSIFQPQLTILARSFGFPPIRSVLRILILTAMDTMAAAAALYAFLPAGAQPELAAFLPAFLLALGAGMILGTPGGMGPFEVVLLSLLPTLPVEALAAAILAYRLVYFAAPAVAA